MSEFPEFALLEEDSSDIVTKKRELNILVRSIIGISSLGLRAVENSDDIPAFKSKLDRVETYWNRFQDLWKSLDRLYVEARRYDQFPTESDLFIFDYVSQEMDEASASSIRCRQQESPPSATIQSINPSVTTHAQPRHSFLPNIKIMPFEGDLLKWCSFRDTFTAMVHNEDLPNIHKFNILRDALKGEAATLISKLSLTGDLYEQAWATVKNHYDNPRVLASHFLRRILDFRPKHQKPSLESYREYLVEIVENIEAFKNLNIQDSTDFLLSLLALQALDDETRREFELKHLGSRFPTTSQVFDFVRGLMTALRMSSDGASGSSRGSNESKSTKFNGRHKGPFQGRSFPRRSSPRYNNTVSFHTSRSDRSNSSSCTSSPVRSRPPTPKKSSIKSASSTESISSTRQNVILCPFCKGSHPLHSCLGFNDLPRQRRLGLVKGWKSCSNCLRSGHLVERCTSKYRCKFCGKRHHSLLHEEKLSRDGSVSGSASEASASEAEEGTTKAFHSLEKLSGDTRYQVLLGTAQVSIPTRNGKIVQARALLDSCSQNSFITNDLAKKIGGRILPSNVSVAGLGGVTLDKPLGALNCIVLGQTNFEVKALVVKCITNTTPSIPVRRKIVEELCKQEVSDENFGTPGPVDMLLGGDVYAAAMTGAPIPTKFGGVYLVPTAFGRVVMGKVPSGRAGISQTMLTPESRSGVEELLERFWELEEPEPTTRQDPLDSYCESQFLSEHQRTAEGRYMVKLPINPNAPALGENRVMATKRFLNLERKLQGDTELYEAYKKFMRDYLKLGHMTPAASKSNYIIPHHGIWQGTPPRRKLRVVFDGSCPSRAPSGPVSLNDTLLSGPKLQADIGEVLTRFRTYAIALTADIVKMYRQVLVHPDQRDLQHIFWRDDPSAPLQEMELNTLTYGLGPCAFLAIRSKRQLVIDEGHAYPLASSRMDDWYVDDFVLGADTLEEAEQLRRELIELFGKGGFTLDKWSSSAPSVLPPSDVRSHPLTLEPVDDHSVKILGMVWDPVSDAFSYAVTQPQLNATKRTLLSMIARVFDPLGLLAPVILSAKHLMQGTWKAKLNWDDPLPHELAQVWESLASEWISLSELSIPRFITGRETKRRFVGFSDASERGFAAVVYLRSEYSDGDVKVHIIKSKTKVSPTRYTSVARLELCGALLLARLMASIRLPGCDPSESCCLTDSMVALSWIGTPTYKLKTFEGNRVAQITEKTPHSSWLHVRSEHNPADLASRGCLPSELHGHELWWHGPSWLSKPYDDWPVTSLQAPERRTMAVDHTLATTASPEDDASSFGKWVARFSSLPLLVRTVVRLLRFAGRSQARCGPITTGEYQHALRRCVYLCQREALPITMFHNEGEIPDAYKHLSLFLDEDGIVRVGGRLREAPMAYEQRHPALIPRTSPLSPLIVADFHYKNFHAGPTLTLALVRSKFWIPGGLRYTKGQIAKCVSCRKLKAKALTPVMASLPKERFAQFRAFVHTGIDFAGPFFIKESRRRRSPRNQESREKAYLCVFVCLASKAIHIECVSSLPTSAFLAALDRFCARRGAPQRIMTDNGSNFLGAARFLRDVWSFLQIHNDVITERLGTKGIEWHFIPPRSPHFGGIWEAGVKSIKNLLNSSFRSNEFTFEEMCTALTRIEGLLNSRPLCPLSDDCEQWDFLTPGHFLIGAPMQFIPDIARDERSPIERWESVHRQVSHIWDRWRREYLHHLQQRRKWLHGAPDLRVGELVVLMERRSVTGHWPVARVVEVHPGADSKVRVVSLRTPSGSILKRSAHNLVPLFPPESPHAKPTCSSDGDKVAPHDSDLPNHELQD